MAKKRKAVELITEIDNSIVKEESDRPKCYGGKKPYCMKELCEEYYDTCTPSENDNPLK